MAKARKLKSGHWNIQVFDYRDPDGKAHYTSFTAPTKYEAEFKAAAYKKDRPAVTKNVMDLTVGQAIDRYIELSAVLSPTSISSYKRVRKNNFQCLMDVPVRKLTQASVQEAINAESKRPSRQTGKTIQPKTVRTAYGLVSAALKEVCNVTYNVKLPKVARTFKQYPEPEEVLSIIVGSEIELPAMLAIWLSFTMSEILGLKASSVRDGCIYIDQVRVYVDGSEVEKKNAKTELRNRAHRLPDHIMTLIKKAPAYKRYRKDGIDGYLITLSRSQIYKKWKALIHSIGYDMTFHDLRHMSASIMLMLGVPEKYAMERGGWATPHVMKDVYQHTFSKERIAVDNIIDAYFEKSLNEQSERQEKNP